jgi:hypothetical protein
MGSVDEGMVRTVGDYAKEIVGQFTSASLEAERLRLKMDEADLVDKESKRKHERQLARWESQQEERREKTIRYAVPCGIVAFFVAVIVAVIYGKVNESTGLIVAFGSLTFAAVQQLMSGRSSSKRNQQRAEPKGDQVR